MATYRQIHTHIWDDPDFEELTPQAKLVFIYGFSNKHRNEAGLYPITFRKLAFETGLTIEEAQNAIREIEGRGMWRYDWDNQVLWVKNALKYQTVTEKNIVAIKKDIQVINSPLVQEFEVYYQDLLCQSEPPMKGHTRDMDALSMKGNGKGKGNGNGKGNIKNISSPVGEGVREVAPAEKLPDGDAGSGAQQHGQAETASPERKKGAPTVGKAAGKGGEYTPDFLEFWGKYPRKVEKRAAFKAWNARRKDGVSPEDMIKAAENYAAYCAAQGTEPRFIKHPATFIGHNRPFEDWIRPRQETMPKRIPRAFASLMELEAEIDAQERGEPP